MATALSIPQTLEVVTPSWLTAVLRRGGTLRNASVTAVQGAALGEGHSLFGMLARLSLTYDVQEPHAPSSLVLKLPLADGPNRQAGLRSGAYSREVRFYQEIGARPGIDLPRVYHTARDEEAERYLLLLEDLRQGHWADPLAGCTLEESRCVVRALAGLHAAWWRRPELGRWSWLSHEREARLASVQRGYAAGWQGFVARFDDLLTPALRAAGPTLGPRVCVVMEQQSGETCTLTHGDTRADNLFFRATAGPLDLTLVDWQNVRRSFSGVWDVVYFLTSAFSSASRRRFEAELLALYYQTLQDQDVTEYPWETFRADCRRATLTIFASTGVVAGGVVGAATPRMEQVLRDWIRGMIDAVTDYDALALLPA